MEGEILHWSTRGPGGAPCDGKTVKVDAVRTWERLARVGFICQTNGRVRHLRLFQSAAWMELSVARENYGQGTISAPRELR